jgi:hypothetical protein
MKLPRIRLWVYAKTALMKDVLFSSGGMETP